MTDIIIIAVFIPWLCFFYHLWLEMLGHLEVDEGTLTHRNSTVPRAKNPGNSCLSMHSRIWSWSFTCQMRSNVYASRVPSLVYVSVNFVVKQTIIKLVTYHSGHFAILDISVGQELGKCTVGIAFLCPRTSGDWTGKIYMAETRHIWGRGATYKMASSLICLASWDA